MDVQLYLQDLKNQLFSDSNWKEIVPDPNWAAQFPDEAGVQAIRQKADNVVIYIGQTGNIKERMEDLLETRNHSARRTLGHRLYKEMIGYEKADQSNKFPAEFEILLDKHVTAELQVAYLKVKLGRLELVEMIVGQLPDESRLNKRGKRGK